MKKYLLDTNHLSAYIAGEASLERKVDLAMRAGHRFGVCLPVLCEYRGGIRCGKFYRRNLARLESSFSFLRVWPCEDATAVEYAEIYCELRSVGRMLSHFDLLIAATVRQRSLTLLTADSDFEPVVGLDVENWLS